MPVSRYLMYKRFDNYMQSHLLPYSNKGRLIHIVIPYALSSSSASLYTSPIVCHCNLNETEAMPYDHLIFYLHDVLSFYGYFNHSITGVVSDFQLLKIKLFWGVANSTNLNGSCASPLPRVALLLRVAMESIEWRMRDLENLHLNEYKGQRKWKCVNCPVCRRLEIPDKVPDAGTLTSQMPLTQQIADARGRAFSQITTIHINVNNKFLFTFPIIRPSLLARFGINNGYILNIKL